jgi:hypothetical protein
VPVSPPAKPARRGSPVRRPQGLSQPAACRGVGPRISTRYGRRVATLRPRLSKRSTVIEAIWSPRTRRQAPGTAGSVRRIRRTSDGSTAAAHRRPVFRTSAPHAPYRRRTCCKTNAQDRRAPGRRRYGPDPTAPTAGSASRNANTPPGPPPRRGRNAPEASYGGSRTATADVQSRAHLSGPWNGGEGNVEGQGCRAWFLAGPPPRGVAGVAIG